MTWLEVAQGGSAGLADTAAMTALMWTDTLALRQPSMDDTHREFVERLNALGAARGAGLAQLRRALDDFVAHTEDHFAQEDAWLARLGFAAESCHGLQHRQVLEVVHEVQRRFSADAAEARLVDELVPALAQWFPVHAQTMDAGLAHAMAESGLDPDSGRLEHAPDAAAAPRTGCGSAACG